MSNDAIVQKWDKTISTMFLKFRSLTETEKLNLSLLLERESAFIVASKIDRIGQFSNSVLFVTILRMFKSMNYDIITDPEGLEQARLNPIKLRIGGSLEDWNGLVCYYGVDREIDFCQSVGDCVNDFFKGLSVSIGKIPVRIEEIDGSTYVILEALINAPFHNYMNVGVLKTSTL